MGLQWCTGGGEDRVVVVGFGVVFWGRLLMGS